MFDQVKEVEEEVAKKERQYDFFGSVEERAVFSEVRACLQHALLSKEVFFRQQSNVRCVK